MRLDGGEIRTVDGSTLQLEWTSLTNGVEYSFSVQAVNAAGPSDCSNLGHGHPSSPTAVPTAITAQDGGAADGKTLTVPGRLQPPSTATRSTTTSSTGRPRTASPTPTRPSRTSAAVGDAGHTYSYTISGVPNNVNYYIAVRAVNASGSSDPGVSAPAYAFPRPILDPHIKPTATAGDQHDPRAHPARADPPGGGVIVAWVLNVYRVAAVQRSRARRSRCGGRRRCPELHVHPSRLHPQRLHHAVDGHDDPPGHLPAAGSSSRARRATRRTRPSLTASRSPRRCRSGPAPGIVPDGRRHEAAPAPVQGDPRRSQRQRPVPDLVHGEDR